MVVGGGGGFYRDVVGYGRLTRVSAFGSAGPSRAGRVGPGLVGPDWAGPSRAGRVELGWAGFGLGWVRLCF
ncbi:hypothetical protein L3i22_089150 [Actinoplanes sp. L3-i22]|nr:hypothetical protein L3i22_089150 [Actinoplanes sp. L3-i22]